ncbi:MAG: hypothetical protein RJQ09_19860 [Cyclobacteriaceae bacterium]
MRLAVILIIEADDLEQKCLLAVKSIRRQHPQDLDIYVVCPRKGKKLSNKTVETLKRFNAQLIIKNLNREHSFFVFANKLYALSHIESEQGQNYDYLIYMDADMVLLKPFTLLFQNSEFLFAAKTSDNSNGMAQNPNKKVKWYWEWIYDSLNIQEDKKWTVADFNGQQSFYAYFNGGLIIAKSTEGYFQKAMANFVLLSSQKSFFKLSGLELFYFEQMILSVTAMQMFLAEEVNILQNEWNYPLNSHTVLKNKLIWIDIKLLHYHEMFYGSNWQDLFSFDQIEYQWLLETLPFTKYNKPVFRRVHSMFCYQLFKLRHKYGIKLI